MKYICVFHTEKLENLEVYETYEEPKYAMDDYITITSNEIYKVISVVFNHDIFNERVFVYVTVRDLTVEELDYIDSMVNSNKK